VCYWEGIWEIIYNFLTSHLLREGRDSDQRSGITSLLNSIVPSRASPEPTLKVSLSSSQGFFFYFLREKSQGRNASKESKRPRR